MGPAEGYAREYEVFTGQLGALDSYRVGVRIKDPSTIDTFRTLLAETYKTGQKAVQLDKNLPPLHHTAEVKARLEDLRILMIIHEVAIPAQENP